MSIVNKFNVNKQEVRLDADIIENMSANDVSYNASTQYDENTVGDKLSELEGEISEIIGGEKTYTSVDGTSARTKIVNVNLKAGQEITIGISDTNEPSSQIAFYEETFGSSNFVNITGVGTKKYIVKNDITKFICYGGSLGISYTTYVVVKTNGRLAEDEKNISDNTKGISILYQETAGILSKKDDILNLFDTEIVDSYTPQVSGRALTFKDRIIKKGDRVKVTLLTDGATSHNIQLTKNTITATPILGIISEIGGVVEFVADEDFTALVGYNNSANTTWSLKIEIINFEEGEITILKNKVYSHSENISKLNDSGEAFSAFAFNRVLFIGDSRTQTTYDRYEDGVLKSYTPVNMPRLIDYGYPKIFQRMQGCADPNILGYGGSTAGRIASDPSRYIWSLSGFESGIESADCDVAFIWLGINDVSVQEFTGTISDIDRDTYPDWHNYPDTSVGGIGKIIAKIRESNENVKMIVLFTLENYKDRRPYSFEPKVVSANGKIRQIAEYTNCEVLELYNDDIVPKNYGPNPVHLNTIGYGRVAKLIYDFLNRIDTTKYKYIGFNYLVE